MKIPIGSKWTCGGWVYKVLHNSYFEHPCKKDWVPAVTYQRDDSDDSIFAKSQVDFIAEFKPQDTGSKELTLFIDNRVTSITIDRISDRSIFSIPDNRVEIEIIDKDRNTYILKGISKKDFYIYDDAKVLADLKEKLLTKEWVMNLRKEHSNSKMRNYKKTNDQVTHYDGTTTTKKEFLSEYPEALPSDWVDFKLWTEVQNRLNS